MHCSLQDRSDQPSHPDAASDAPALKAPREPSATKQCATGTPTTITSSDAVNEACNKIYKCWIRFVPHHEALAQANQFRQRFQTLVSEGIVTEAEFDVVLGSVADAVAEPR